MLVPIAAVRTTTVQLKTFPEMAILVCGTGQPITVWADFWDTPASTSSSDVSSDVMGPPQNLNHTANQEERRSDPSKYPTVTGLPPPPGANASTCYTIMSDRRITRDESVASSEGSSTGLSPAFRVRIWTTDGALLFYAFYNPASVEEKFSDYIFIPPATSQYVIPGVTSKLYKKARGTVFRALLS